MYVIFLIIGLVIFMMMTTKSVETYSHAVSSQTSRGGLSSKTSRSGMLSNDTVVFSNFTSQCNGNSGYKKISAYSSQDDATKIMNTFDATYGKPTSVEIVNGRNTPVWLVHDPSCSQVSFYGDCNYSGTTKDFKSGSYPWIASAGFPNDTLSSLKIPDGCDVTLFDNINYGGSSVTLTSDAPCLTSQKFNDKTSSFKINCT